MQIRHMTATFGKLCGAELTLSPGLNLIYAPNESGKSTWSHFMRTMLYGLSTRDRGPLADKNRFAPWNGAAMQGRMDVLGESAYVITRTTRRANAPMAEFCCTYDGTADNVDGITGQNLGEILLGVPREVFERSAFIGQSALAVDQDAELERRIAALITTGEEDISFSESYDRLKKQQNRRRHNKTGMIPELEREIATLQASLDMQDSLTQQAAAAQSQLQEAQRQLAQLQDQEKLWQKIEQQEKLRRYEEARAQADSAAQKAEWLAETAGLIPQSEALQRMEGQCAAIESGVSRLSMAQAVCSEKKAAYDEAMENWQRHSLYPAKEAELQTRLESMQEKPLPGGKNPFAGLGCIAVAMLAVAIAGIIGSKLWLSIPAIVLFFAAVGMMAYYIVRRKKVSNANSVIAAQRRALEEQLADYLPLQKAAEDAAALYENARLRFESQQQQQQEALLALSVQLQPYQSDVTDLSGAKMALSHLRQQSDAIDAARRAAREALLRCEVLQEQLPSGDPTDFARPLPQPSIRKELIAQLLPQTLAAVQSTRSRVDTLTGQLRALGDGDVLRSQLVQKSEQLAAAQREYDSISIAMEALAQANTTLQNRFSPALGARAAEIFSEITAGRYRKVLLSRDFSLSAEETDGLAMRSVHLLSRGTADQLYLAVRLAICDMVLPADKSVPLILDDALLSFDDERLHAALDYLLKESQTRQILLFSCQKREQDYLRGQHGVTEIIL